MGWFRGPLHLWGWSEELWILAYAFVVSVFSRVFFSVYLNAARMRIKEPVHKMYPIFFTFFPSRSYFLLLLFSMKTGKTNRERQGKNWKKQIGWILCSVFFILIRKRGSLRYTQKKTRERPKTTSECRVSLTNGQQIDALCSRSCCDSFLL